jgi:hypothetical protein
MTEHRIAKTARRHGVVHTCRICEHGVEMGHEHAELDEIEYQAVPVFDPATGEPIMETVVETVWLPMVRAHANGQTVSSPRLVSVPVTRQKTISVPVMIAGASSVNRVVSPAETSDEAHDHPADKADNSVQGREADSLDRGVHSQAGSRESEVELSDLPAADEPDDDPSGEDDDTGDTDQGEEPDDVTVSSVAVGHEGVPEPDAGDYHKSGLAQPVESGEPIPDALADLLARLVPQGDLDAKKLAAGKRWIELNAIRLDMAKSQASRAFENLTPTQQAELDLLDRWAIWFN